MKFTSKQYQNLAYQCSAKSFELQQGIFNGTSTDLRNDAYRIICLGTMIGQCQILMMLAKGDNNVELAHHWHIHNESFDFEGLFQDWDKISTRSEVQNITYEEKEIS